MTRTQATRLAPAPARAPRYALDREGTVEEADLLEALDLVQVLTCGGPARGTRRSPRCAEEQSYHEYD
jgi:hypothetical protein